MGVTEIEPAIPHDAFITTDVRRTAEKAAPIMNASLFTKATAGLLGTIGVAGAGLGIIKLPQAPVTAPPAPVSAPAAPSAAPVSPQAPIVIQTPAAAPAAAPAPVPEKVIEHSAPIIVNSPAPGPSGDVSSTNGPAINVNVASTNNNVQEQANQQKQDQTDTQTQTQTAPATPATPAAPKPPVKVVTIPKTAPKSGLGSIGAQVGPAIVAAPKKSTPGIGTQINDTINKVLPCDPIRSLAGLC